MTERQGAYLEMSLSPSGVFLLVAGPHCSLSWALSLLERAPFPGPSVAVLLEDAHPSLSGLPQLPSGQVDRWVVIGDPLEGLPGDCFPDMVSAATHLELLLAQGGRVLLAGAAAADLVRYAPTLREALSPAQATVDLDALLRNANRFREATGGAAVLPVIKANAYGLGAPVLGWTLADWGAEGFVVAYPDEGVELRKGGIQRPILVQNALEPEVAKLVRNGLEVQVSSVEQVGWLAEEAARTGRVVGVHVKVDTGMSRAGLLPAEAAALALQVSRTPGLALAGLMTHLASADEPAEDGFTQTQLQRFEAVRSALSAEGVVPRWVHAANSSGTARFPEAHLDAIRAGIALWGYASALPLATHPVVRLTTRVVSVKWVEAGETVGYGRTWATGDRPRHIAVVAIGYYDGYPRALSNLGWMGVHGTRCPVVGRVCMDVTMIDVTHLGGGVRAGDEVVVYGAGPDEPDLERLAALVDTIPYELLTRLSPRIRRIYRRSCPTL
ncbi:MAG: alanine racemase [Deltaproteobacteria bacterium]|nr:alanine racemase [Deltaproteobacteria bacterium]